MREYKCIMKEDIFFPDMDLVLLPDDIFDVPGYSRSTFDCTNYIEDYVTDRLSDLNKEDKVSLYLNYGVTQGVIAALNVIRRKGISCDVFAFDSAKLNYVFYDTLSLAAMSSRGVNKDASYAFRTFDRHPPFDIPSLLDEKSLSPEVFFDKEYIENQIDKVFCDLKDEHIEIYATGVKHPLISCINVADKYNIKLTIRIYNRDDCTSDHFMDVY